MTTFTTPNTLASDPYLRGDKLEANFAYAKSFLGLEGSVGIGSGNLASTVSISPEQLAENHSLSYVTLTVVKATMGSSSEDLVVPVVDEIRLRSMSLNVHSSDGLACSATATISDRFSFGSGTSLTFDSSAAPNDAMLTFGYAKTVKAGGSIYLSISGLSANVDVASVTLCFSHKHTSK